jgi:polyisoprenoid-binding protein YceI
LPTLDAVVVGEGAVARRLPSPAVRDTARTWPWVVALLLVFPSARTLDADAGASWHVVSGDVRVVCPMTVGGSFEARTGAMHGTVTTGGAGAALGGDLSVDLRTLDTGIGLRNEHLWSTYLEVGRGQGFDRAVLSEIRLGDAEPGKLAGRTSFTGSFLLHGTTKPIAGQANVRREGRSVHVDASFPVTLAAFGIEKPRYLGVGVKDQVTVTVSLMAEPGDAAEVAR